MSKYIKKFNSHAEYNAFTATTAFILPNVSLCVNEDDLHYNPLVKVSGVTLDKSELSIKEGDTETLVATVLPSNASNKNITWSSSNDSVATVDSNGVVSGVGVGNADITVTTEDGGYTAQCATSVKNYKVITYTATEKLQEGNSGININAFSGTNGQRLTMVSHTFDDGVGTVTFNGDIAKIGNYAFQSCSGFTSIEIPDSVTSIGEGAFKDCTGLTSMVIPDGVTSIGVCAFIECYSLTSIVIPDSVTSIGESAFSYCYNITSCTIGSGLTSISNYAFTNCSGMTSCTIGSGVTSIGTYAFNNCRSLTNINIPSGVTSIGERAFTYCSGLTSINIPDSVTSIGESAFNCCGMTACTIGSGVTSIGDYVFANCTGLTSIDIPNSVISIGTGAFYECRLTSATVEATTPPILSSWNAFGWGGDYPIYVPSESVNTYKAASGWRDLASRIQAIP